MGDLVGSVHVVLSGVYSVMMPVTKHKNTASCAGLCYCNSQLVKYL